jgi:hypothetical protein
VVDEGPLAVDLDHGQPFAVARLELRVTRDVDLDELEAELVTGGEKGLTRPVAEVATGRVKERYAWTMDTARASWSPRRRA